MLDLSNTTSFSSHRHGWSFVMSSIKDFHSKSGIYICDFIEKDFSWSKNTGFEIGRKWIGFIHNPPNMPPWFDFHNSPQCILKREKFLDYSKNCICLFVLSEYLKKYIQNLTNIPVFNFYHPTELDIPKWNPELFLKSKNIVQVGYWLRKMHSITTVTKNYNLEWLPSDYNYAMTKKVLESQSLGYCEYEMHKIWSKVKVYNHISNEDYDKKLCSSVALCDMYDSSANNAIIECIARHTPIITPKLPAVIEYLGEDYPLYINGLIDDLLCEDKIIAAHEYLKKKDKEFLSKQFFRNEIKKCILKLEY